MNQENESLKTSKYFPLYLTHFALFYFSANIDTIYFLETLITLEQEWIREDFMILILICSSSFSLIFGNYFSFLFLRFNIRNSLLVSFFFQAMSCIVGSFSKNILAFCISKIIYNTFFGISSKIIVILPLLNKYPENNEKKQGNLFLFLLQGCQIFIKMWVCLTCFLIPYPNLKWSILSMNNSLFSIVSLIGVIFMSKSKKDFMKNIHAINPKKDKSYMKHKNYNAIFILVVFFALFELINNQIFMNLFFISRNSREILYQIYLFIFGDFIGFILSILECITYTSKKMSFLFLLIIYGSFLFYLCVHISGFLEISFFFIIFRSLLLLIKNMIFAKLDHLNSSMIIFILTINDSILAIAAILFFSIFKQYFNNLIPFICGVIFIILFCLILKERKEKKQSKNEFEMQLLK